MIDLTKWNISYQVAVVIMIFALFVHEILVWFPILDWFPQYPILPFVATAAAVVVGFSYLMMVREFARNGQAQFLEPRFRFAVLFVTFLVCGLILAREYIPFMKASTSALVGETAGVTAVLAIWIMIMYKAFKPKRSQQRYTRIQE